MRLIDRLALTVILLAAAGAQAQPTTVTTSPAAPTNYTPTTIVLFNPCGCPQYTGPIIRNGFTFDITHGSACLSACLATTSPYSVGYLEPGTYTVRHFLQDDPSTAQVIGTFVVAAGVAPVPALDDRGLAVLALTLTLVAFVVLRRISG